MKRDDKMTWADQDWRDEIARLEAENEKLRAAYEKLRAKLQAAIGELCDSAAKAALGESDE